MELKKLSLGEIGPVRMCKRILKEQTNNVNGIPFYKIGTFGGLADSFISETLYQDYKKRFSFPKTGDVLISAAGTIGRTVKYNGEDAYYQDSNIVWIENDETKVLNDYLFYCYKRIRWFTSTGSTILRLYNENIQNSVIYVPELRYQRIIADILSSIDSKITNNNAIISELESMAKDIYDYWFVQFDFPDASGRPYRSSGGKMVWNEELKREIPEGWIVKQLNEMCSFSNGINYDKNEAGDKKYHIVNVRNITASSFLLDNSEFDEIELRSSQANRYLINDSDILVARSGTPGAVRLLLNNDQNTIFCGFIIRCIPKSIKFRFYLSFALKQYEGTNATKTGGSILQNVSQDTLGRVSVIVPQSEIVDTFSSFVSGFFSRMQNAIEENQQLSSLRDWLLPMLMNGQVKVGGAV